MHPNLILQRGMVPWLSSSVVDTRSPMVFRVTSESIN